MTKVLRGAAAGLALVTVVGCGGEGQGAPAAPAATPAGQMAGQATTAATPETRTFRDWMAVCDNGLDCVAFSGGDSGWLRIAMAAGPDATPSITAGVFLAEDGPDIVLDVDGARFTTSIGEDGQRRIAQDEAREALAALAAGQAVALDTGGDRIAISAAGVSASLLWIDERQGRLDTETALIRRGDRPASAVPAAPALPRVTPLAAVDQGNLAGAVNPSEQGGEAGLALPASLEALAEVRQCREETAHNEYLSRAILAGRLSADRELWGVPCGAGAYNATYLMFVSGPGGADPVKAELPTWNPAPRQEGDIAGEGLVNPIFDPAANTLEHFPRGRGLGDCGVIQRWAWTGTEGFVLTQERVMGECWGMTPDIWPTTWRTR